MITRKAKYGLKAMFYLAKTDSDSYIRIQEIASHEQIPRRFLEHILVELKKNKLVKSKIGINGGYRLAAAPDKISIGQIIRTLDGLLEPEPCLKAMGKSVCEECTNIQECTIRNILNRMLATTELVLNNMNLGNANIRACFTS